MLQESGSLPHRHEFIGRFNTNHFMNPSLKNVDTHLLMFSEWSVLYCNSLYLCPENLAQVKSQCFQDGRFSWKFRATTLYLPIWKLYTNINSSHMRNSECVQLLIWTASLRAKYLFNSNTTVLAYTLLSSQDWLNAAVSEDLLASSGEDTKV